MEQQVEMRATVRDGRGKNAARRLRASGQVPAVLYGLSKDSIALTLDATSIVRVLQSPAGHNQILHVAVDGGEEVAALATDWQVDPVKSKLLHVDLQRVDLTKPVDVTVPIHTIGPSRGVKEQGGIEEILVREVHMRALPRNVPARIDVDITEMNVGQSVRVRDLPTSEHYEYTSNADLVLLHIVAPKVGDTAETEEPAAAAPEVKPEAGKGKE